ncbi:hypothetical protein ACWGH3_03760 [Streptomyces sp. NPDC054884]|uniref:hypothetical protein n=1 Tax=Streptomyces sp. ME08-AFT2 TaxID=3028683 RepID=UPI0029A4F199|nr:hypothetical protein [Streptomyces sp. ME08-AFT2]MDX3307971.1 hypothetical protein [Streptomyces sp. ME08-AFT2]
MKSVRKMLPSVCMVAAVLVLLSACSGSEDGDGKDRNDAPIGWSTCNALFGADRIDALQDAMGEGTLETLNSPVPVDELMSARAAVTRRWEPGKELSLRTRDHPCELGVDNTNKRFASYAAWALDSPARITAGKAGSGWESAGSVYVKREDAGLHVFAVFPCKIKGSHKDQEAGLPFEVETQVRNVPNFDTKLLDEMTTQFVRTLAEGLPCTNDLHIPATL